MSLSSNQASHSESTRERIQIEAARLFVASGYHGVSMREVAEAVGVTKPALYHHYSDKESLFLAILKAAVINLGGLIERANSQEGIRAQLHTLVGDLIDSAPAQRVGMQLASELRHVSAERRAAFDQEYRQVWMGGLAKLINQAVEQGELRADLPPTVLTRAFLATIFPLVSGPPLPEPHETAKALLSVYLDGATAQ